MLEMSNISNGFVGSLTIELLAVVIIGGLSALTGWLLKLRSRLDRIEGRSEYYPTQDDVHKLSESLARQEESASGLGRSIDDVRSGLHVDGLDPTSAKIPSSMISSGSKKDGPDCGNLLERKRRSATDGTLVISILEGQPARSANSSVAALTDCVSRAVATDHARHPGVARPGE